MTSVDSSRVAFMFALPLNYVGRQCTVAVSMRRARPPVSIPRTAIPEIPGLQCVLLVIGEFFLFSGHATRVLASESYAQLIVGHACHAELRAHAIADSAEARAAELLRLWT
jgi:hypothetical protein